MSAIYIGNIIHCKGPNDIEVLENGFLIEDEGKITMCGSKEELRGIRLRGFAPILTVHLKPSQILIPGLIDSHIHAPQYPNIGLGFDLPLMKWLDTYTYRLESKYSDLEFSKRVYDAVVQKTLAFGTTTACYFASMWKDSTDVLVDSVIRGGQRAFVGKVNMTMLASPEYIETEQESVENTKKFVADLLAKNNDLVKPVITPRFALSCEDSLMKTLAAMAKEHNLLIQSHISENCAEIQMVHDRFNSTYAEAYDSVDLLTEKTILAHAVHLEDSECDLLAKKGCSVSHCPSSNIRLQSGACDIKRLIDKGVTVGLGTDVAGGQSVSIIEAMRLAIDTSIHISFKKDGYKPIDYKDAFYLATLGGAKALSLNANIGNFEIGKDFDGIIVDMAATNCSANLIGNYSAMEILQKFIYLGDDRNVNEVFVFGKSVKKINKCQVRAGQLDLYLDDLITFLIK